MYSLIASFGIRHTRDVYKRKYRHRKSLESFTSSPAGKQAQSNILGAFGLVILMGIPAPHIFLHRSMAVSYTHLDVSKRQRFACSFCTSNPVWNTNYRPGKYELLRPIRWKPWKHWILVVVFLQVNEQSQISQHKDGIAADTQKSFREAEPLLVSLDLLLG